MVNYANLFDHCVPSSDGDIRNKEMASPPRSEQLIVIENDMPDHRYGIVGTKTLKKAKHFDSK